MFLTIRSKESMALSAAFVFVFIFGITSPLHASDPHSASYSMDNDNIFWFIQTSDVHVGAWGYPGSENLEWLLTEAKDIIAPSFIVVTGDLTDSSDWNHMGYPDGPHIEEWEEYWDIVNTDGINPDFYYDLPGNHDHFGDENFQYYLNNSIQGVATGQTQFSWTRTFDFGTYHFLGINTCGHDGADFSMLPPTYGDNAGLDTDELKFIADDLEDNKDADLTMIFGHHLIVKRETDWSYVTGDALEEMTMTALIYGADALTALMEYYHPLMYAYGHSHVYREEFFIKDMTEGVVYLNVASLSKNDEKNYNIIAIDNNGISTTPHTKGVWPAVIITAPLDKNLGMENDPYTTDVEDLTGSSTPIRALVFDTKEVTRVDYRMYKITEDVGDIVETGVGLVGGLVESEDMWCPMAQVASSHRNYPYLWEADCPNPLEGGDYTIEVRATGSSVQRDSVPTAFPADPVDEEGLCFISAAASGRQQADK